ncbi:MAG TPA: MBL fold metallo-hydrolase [Candidatus Nitrosopolaris sp.]|nr:MBL fold metallo-hydrolase [Candidatus Nitrosopolaris sp.]
MKTTFRPRLLNGQTGDPALLLTLRWQGRALLLDLGRIDRVPAALLLPIEAVFVSHAHMDHFMGFDQLLRLFLARDTTLRLYGPPGLADCVAGKLAGYVWNLTDEYAFTIEVTEIAPGEMRTFRFPARRRFVREPIGGPRPFDGVAFADSVLTVEAAPLDHRIISMAYAVSERTHLNVRPDALAAAGLRPGQWLNVLKTAVRSGADDDTPIEVLPGDRRPLGELRDTLLSVTPGQKIAYVVDTLFSPANVAAIVRLAAGADLFFCESPFLDDDREQATRRYHLTARQAGALARAARVRRLQVFHFSPRYEGRYGEIVAEADAEFSGQEIVYGGLERGGAALS